MTTTARPSFGTVTISGICADCREPITATSIVDDRLNVEGQYPWYHNKTGQELCRMDPTPLPEGWTEVVGPIDGGDDFDPPVDEPGDGDFADYLADRARY